MKIGVRLLLVYNKQLKLQDLGRSVVTNGDFFIQPKYQNQANMKNAVIVVLRSYYARRLHFSRKSRMKNNIFVCSLRNQILTMEHRRRAVSTVSPGNLESFWFSR